jgi:hypothetical protein
MEIQRFFNKKIKIDYFFIVGKIDIDADYFIKKIKEGVKKEDNMNYLTNVNGAMTSWDYFNNDEKFTVVLSKFIEYVDKNLDLQKYALKDAWGLELKKFENTKFHTHQEDLWSGVLYLNHSNQNLIFPDIKQEVKPDKGVFCLFNGFLKHGCYKNMDNSSKYAIAFNIAESKPY